MTLSELGPRTPGRTAAVALGSTLALIAVLRLLLLPPQPRRRITPSPRETQLPSLSDDAQAALPYPPDVFPGGRDVQSCYGVLRVYEWGPEEGRKVLLVHGISTPCLSLGAIAEGLVQRGCRVCLFDLWGRGYSDQVDDLPHDSRLFETAMLLAVTSSPLSWTPGGFSLVGYSLGGGIAVDFTVAHPDLVRALVLLAPAGLIRPHHFGWQSWVMYSPFTPRSVLEWIVRRRQTKSGAKPKSEAKEKDTVNADVKGERDPNFEDTPLSKTRPDITIGDAVAWQLAHHEGYVSAFVSSIKYASIKGEGHTLQSWRKLGLRTDKVLLFAGSTDTTILSEELKVDAHALIGAEKLDFRSIDGGHEFPITCSEEVLRQIGEVWGI